MLNPRARSASVRESASAPELPQFERLLAELSTRFVNLPAAQVDGAITDALRQIVLLLDVDRCQLIRFPPGPGEAEVTHSWAIDGVAVVRPKSISEAYPWAIARWRAGHPVVVPRVDDLPTEAEVDKASWRRVGARSHLGMPMKAAGRIEGLLAFGCLRRERDWPEELVARMGVLATVFGNALAHKRAQEALDVAIAFERTVSDVLAALLTTGSAEQDRVIEVGLRDLARVFGAERAALWQRFGEKAEFTNTHRWVAEGVPTPPDSVGAVTTPWISTQLVQGSLVRFARHADLPREAAADLPGLQALNIRAGVIVPLMVSGPVVGALSFATMREDREWPDALVPRVTLLGEVFAGVLARQEAERREQDARAQAAHAARVGTMGVVAASLVHELTQPLAASLANAETAAELLAAPAPDLDELRAAVEDIVADNRRVGDLIQQLRHFLRRGEVERAEVDVRAAVDDAMRLAGNVAAEKGVEIAVDLSFALPKLAADRVQLQQVILNLLLNAIDAVAAVEPRSRRVTLLARPSKSGVGIEVTDAGPGMDERTLARIFQPFFTTKPGGMGLGLSISRSIVAAHGGTLSVRSAPGRGTTFRIELPLRPPAEPPRAAPAATAPADRAGTVFVVDDDPSMRRALDRQLQGAGYRVEAFRSAQDYLDRAPPSEIACIVSDVRMPGLSGLDLQASLARADRDLPIVFISGHGDVPTAAHALKAGAVGFLAKPFSKGELLAAVAEALARSRERASAREEGAALRARYESLTSREREVFALVAAGLMNKHVADRLGIAEKTVKVHRGRVMEKLAAGSVADLVRIAERLGPQAAGAPASQATLNAYSSTGGQ
jgi:FixJ family two-component response regulator/signal transduction histidine kinase